MNVRRINVNAIDLLTYMIFIVLIKISFIPSIIRQVIKISVLIIIFFFLISKLRKKEVLNASVFLVISILISGFYNYMLGKYKLELLLDSAVYAISFHDLYTLFLYGYKHNEMFRIKKCLYNIVLLFCILTVVSVIIVGTSNNSNTSVYLFGNKFMSSYLFVTLIALYGATHDVHNKKNKSVFYVLVLAGILFTLHVKCATATVSLLISIIIYIISKLSNKTIFWKPQLISSVLIGTSLVPLVIDYIVKIDFINNIIFGIFNRGYTVYGRFEIYNSYLFQLIKDKLIFGYGYNNGKMLEVTGVFSNVQNGLLEQVMSFGLVGASIIVVLVYYCIRKSKNDAKTICLFILLYTLIIASIFEVTINWLFWIVVFLIRWSDS